MKKKIGRNQQIMMTPKQIEKIRKDTIKDTLKLMRLFPLLALRDRFGFGEVRLRRYMEKFDDLIDSYNKDYIDLVDVAKVMKEEGGIDVWNE